VTVSGLGDAVPGERLQPHAGACEKLWRSKCRGVTAMMGEFDPQQLRIHAFQSVCQQPVRDQRSVGARRLTEARFDTHVVYGQIATSFRNAIVRAAFSTSTSEERIRSPRSSYPVYIG
jgi:hypothetical protein